MTISDFFSRHPLGYDHHIPIFSTRDFYIENYEKISADHVNSITDVQENPFIEESLWNALESETQSFIRKYLPSGSTILDIGVGLGRLLSPLEEYKRYGVDISMDYLKIAKSRNIDVAYSKIEDLPFFENSFDMITVCDVLEHVLDLNLCTQKILECLKPGGKLIVRVPYAEDLSPYLDSTLPYELVHLRSFDKSSLRLHFEKIFHCSFVESSIVAPYLQGNSRLTLRLLPNKSLDTIRPLLKKISSFASVKPAFSVSEEVFLNWIYALKANEPTTFKEVSPYLLHGMDVISIFQKD